MILTSKCSPNIFLKTLNFFFPNPQSICDATAYCPGEFCWQNQTVLSPELLGARKIGKCDHPIGRQSSNGDDRAVGI